MNATKFFLGLATAVLTTTACQSNNFKINGVAEGFEDGDTIVLYEAINNQALDTIIVKDGKFSYKGESDSVIVCALMPTDNSASVLFFREKGTINVVLSKTNESKVSGTTANDAWQAMNDKQAEIQAKAQDLLAPIYGGGEDISETQRDSIINQYNLLQQQMTDNLLESIEANIGNEYGYFVLTQMSGNGLFDNDKVEELIGKMPENFKQRQAIQDIIAAIENTKKTDIGHTLEDIILPTPETLEMNVLDEVKKNKITVLDFWASWCGPCCREMPFMKSLLEKNSEKGFGIVGISLDQDVDAWKGAISELGMTWPQVWDNQQKTAEAFNVQAIPFTVVVDQQGTILAKDLRGTELEAFVQEQLEK